MNTDKYNARIGQAINNEYVKCFNRIEELRKEEANIHMQIIKAKEEYSLSLSKFLGLDQRKTELQEEIDELAIELNVWNRAREICLDIERR